MFDMLCLLCGRTVHLFPLFVNDYFSLFATTWKNVLLILSYMVLFCLLQTFTYMTPYAVWKALLVLAIQIINTFVWNFGDLFVSLFAMGLSARFHQVNTEIETTTIQVRVVLGKHLSLRRSPFVCNC